MNISKIACFADSGIVNLEKVKNLVRGGNTGTGGTGTGNEEPGTTGTGSGKELPPPGE